MRFCPYAQRIHLVLEAKSIPHHVINVSLTEKPEWLTQFNALGQVPILRLTNEPGNPAIYDSMVIADYLDAKYPQVPLYPTDPLAKAFDRLLIDKFSGIFMHAYMISMNGVNEERYKGLFDGLDLFESELKKRGTPFFGGDNPNMLDYTSFPFFERVLALEYFVDQEEFKIKADRFPLLLQWKTALLEYPAIKNNYINGENHAEYLKAKKAGNIDFDFLL